MINYIKTEQIMCQRRVPKKVIRGYDYDRIMAFLNERGPWTKISIRQNIGYISSIFAGTMVLK